MSSACAKVLNTYELLENILLCLPFRDLLFSQRINKNFKSVVERSDKVQQKLYRSPMPNGGSHKDHPSMDVIFDSMPLFSTTPLKRQHGESLQEHITCFAGENTEGANERVLKALYLAKKPTKKRDKGTNPSWKSMLVTQPPFKNVRVMALETDGVCGPEAKLQVDGGVTFTDLMEKMGQWRDQHPKGKDWRGAMFFIDDVEYVNERRARLYCAAAKWVSVSD